MKIFLLLFFALFLFTKATPQLPPCNFRTAAQAIPPRIFAETTIDGRDQHVLLTRFLHNKLGIYLSEFSRCYFASLDPNFIIKSVGLIGLVSWLYFFYKILIKKSYVLIIIFLLIPFLPFLTVPIIIVAFIYKLFAIMGFAYFIIKKS